MFGLLFLFLLYYISKFQVNV